MRVGDVDTRDNAPYDDSDIDLASLGRALWQRKRWILIPAAIVAIASIVAVNVVSPRYKSEARVLIEGRENAFLRPEAEKSMDRTLVDQEAVASQVQILTSRDLAQQVINSLKLSQLPEFDPVLQGASLPTTILSLFGLAKDPLRMTPEERVLQSFFERLNVLPVDKSRVITVEFQSSDPVLAARVANAIADAYLSFQQAAKQQQTRGASQWLATEIEKLRGKVSEADSKVEDFRSKANLFVGTNNSTLAAQQLTDLTTQLAAARGQKADLDAKARLIRDMLKSGRPVESADIVNSDLLKRLVEQRVTLRAQLAEQSSTLLGLHPRIQELRAQIGALDSQIRGELERLVRSIENDARIASAKVETTSNSLEQLKRQVSGSNGQDVQLRALEREAKAQRDLLESYLAKYREATARDSIEAAPADARIISRAVVSNVPVFPKKTPIVLIATLATIFLTATIIISNEFLNGGTQPVPVRQLQPVTIAPSTRAASRLAFWGRARKAPAAANPPAGSPAEPSFVPEREVAPAIASGPSTKPPSASEPLAAPAPLPLSELAQALRNLGEAGRRITVIGSARHAGTTQTAIGLARMLASTARVVVIDLSLNAPSLSNLSANPAAPGIAELVRGQASFGDIITRDRSSRVHLIAAGQGSAQPGDVLASPRLATVLQALARTYDHVVLDAGAVSEAPVDSFVRLAPRAVLVTRDAAHPDTAAARETLVAAGFENVTVFVSTPQTEQGARPAAA